MEEAALPEWWEGEGGGVLEDSNQKARPVERARVGNGLGVSRGQEGGPRWPGWGGEWKVEVRGAGKPLGSKLRSTVGPPPVGPPPVELGLQGERSWRYREEEAVECPVARWLRAGSPVQAAWAGCGASVQAPVLGFSCLGELLSPQQG